MKANAYGHGAVEIARALEAGGAAGFCVAAADEALELRRGGIRAPILVLYPVPVALAPELARRRISVTAGDLDLLREMAGSVAGLSSRRRLGVHLEVETGLGRGGFREVDLGTASDIVAAAAGLRLAGLWTHLQAPEDVDRTTTQLERFDAATIALRDAGHRLPARHVAASSGLLLGNAAALEGVRPGLTVYGLVPDELLGREVPGRAALRPVMSFHARPVRVVDLPAGWGIGYGPTFVTARPSRIATLPLGYGDGWPRSLSNRATVLVRGQRVPLVGNVAMDAVMADVTDVPGPPVTAADEVVLLGRQGSLEITAADLAESRSTNSWEVVTAMAARLPRVYHAPSGALGLRTLVSAPDPTGHRAIRRRTTGS
ncbi:MAG: alanine racemase [Chloroflexi bacterium]|nr:alanine racemase [Chloroflexota bacterium]